MISIRHASFAIGADLHPVTNNCWDFSPHWITEFERNTPFIPVKEKRAYVEGRDPILPKDAARVKENKTPPHPPTPPSISWDTATFHLLWPGKTKSIKHEWDPSQPESFSSCCPEANNPRVPCPLLLLRNAYMRWKEFILAWIFWVGVCVKGTFFCETRHSGEWLQNEMRSVQMHTAPTSREGTNL